MVETWILGDKVMRVKNEKLLGTYRQPGPCEICGKPCSRREPFHISACGTSSHKQIDAPCNLLAVGSSLNFCCPCHTRYHAEHVPTRLEAQQIAADREGMDISEVQAVVALLQRASRAPWPCEVCVGVNVGRGYFVCSRCGKVVES